MKQFIFPFLFMAVLVIGINSCQKENCQECHKVTYENGVKVAEDTTCEMYCGDNIESKENDTTVVGNRKRTWECNEKVQACS